MCSYLTTHKSRSPANEEKHQKTREKMLQGEASEYELMFLPERQKNVH